jgi:hypothetical protein
VRQPHARVPAQPGLDQLAAVDRHVVHDPLAGALDDPGGQEAGYEATQSTDVTPRATVVPCASTATNAEVQDPVLVEDDDRSAVLCGRVLRPGLVCGPEHVLGLLGDQHPEEPGVADGRPQGAPIIREGDHDVRGPGCSGPAEDEDPVSARQHGEQHLVGVGHAGDAVMPWGPLRGFGAK